MSKKIGSILVLVILLVSACSPAGTSTRTTGPAGTKTPMPAPSATPGPSTTLKQDALLYSGPGNADFDTTASLNAGATVTLLAMYGDFVKVNAVIAGQRKHRFHLERGAFFASLRPPRIDRRPGAIGFVLPAAMFARLLRLCPRCCYLFEYQQ